MVAGIRQAALPVGTSFGCFMDFNQTKSHNINDSLDLLFRQRSYEKAFAYVNSAGFYWKCLALGSSIEAQEMNRKDNRLPDKQYALDQCQRNEVFFLVAVTSAIVKETYKLALYLAMQRNASVDTTLKTKEFLDKFEQFHNRYLTEQSRNVSSSPYLISQKIMSAFLN